MELGYFRALKLKYIYVMRYWCRDNYLYESWLADIHRDLLKDFRARNLPTDDHNVYQVPVYEFKDITPQRFYKDYLMVSQSLRRTKDVIIDDHDVHVRWADLLFCATPKWPL